MRIITISREFGSGGRELGKRLAEQLGFNYFDREIITEIASHTNLDENYIHMILEKGLSSYPIHIGQTFTGISAINHTPIEVLIAQQKILKELAEQGDEVFIGRSADAILKDYNPLNIFVYADMDYKLERCKAKGEVDINLKDKVLCRKIKNVDKGRYRNHNLLGCSKWGDRKSYHLMVNTTGFNIQDIVPSVKEYAIKFFEKQK
jgi:cytidylate kinase